jgi:hypothetical protein
MAKQMQQSMPASMQRYIGPYMAQNITSPHMTTMAAPGVVATPHAPINTGNFNSHFPRQTTNPVPQQLGQSPAQVQITPQPLQPPLQPATVAQSEGPQPSYAAPQAQAAPVQPYEFITNPNPGQPTKQPLLASLPGGNSVIKRVGLVAGGLLLLVIIFSVLKGLVSGGSNLPLYMSVLEDQQALIHLTTNANTPQTSLSLTDKNFTATALISLTSSQADLAALLQTNNLKINTNLLASKVSTTIDTQLTNAATAGTYDQTYQEIMKSGLAQYQKDLNAAYQKATSTKSRGLLKSDYVQAGLLLKQLDAATTS